MEVDVREFCEPIKLVLIACLESDIQRELVFRNLYIRFSTAEVG